ncbi:hypothetical protein [Umezawaea beigongshangensis]|uniref:hypothetical protein n=1 Tax=Umezawaea beigongshangensis TaxID=2780383 RepID=UPI0018F270D9|nr:hypothetical protein [Umezawaea beigongshangensis]
MPDEKLSARQKNLLFILANEAREVSNTRLDERWKLSLTGKDRTRLNDLGLVTSRKAGRVFVHELTDRGWSRCREELSAELPDRAGSFGAALYSFLGTIDRFLEAKRLDLADLCVPNSRPVPESDEDGTTADRSDLETRVRAVYEDLAGAPRDWVSLAELRPRLGEVPRSEVDDVLRRMDGAPDVTIAPEANQRVLTTADHDAAVHIGGEANHLLSIGRA